MNNRKIFIVYIGKLFSFLFTYKIYNLLHSILITFHSGWISRTFKSYGDNSYIKLGGYFVGTKNISIGNNCYIGSRAAITSWGGKNNQLKIIIKNNVCIGDDCHITAFNQIIINDNVLLGKKVTITDNSHGQSKLKDLNEAPLTRPIYSSGAVIIEEGVWIGDKVTILPNVNIGKFSVIGANSVVISNIPDYCVAVGAPAVIVRRYNEKSGEWVKCRNREVAK